MFPRSDSSQTIIDCFWREVKRLGIEVRTQQRVTGLLRQGKGFAVQLATGDSLPADALLLATGSQTTVWEWLQRDWGLELVPPVPSLFTFNINDPALHALAGLSVPLAKLDFPANKKLQAQGPLLITHWGLSGPVVLRLSAWGARWLHEQQYRSSLRVNWLGEASMAEIQADLQAFKEANPKKALGSQSPFGTLPQRLWAYLLQKSGASAQRQWANLPKAQAQALQQNLGQCLFAVDGKSTFKEEFVTAGGLALSEIDFTSFQAKKIPGMFFAGEILDIDAITGGFNFQAAWTGAWIAAQGIADWLQKDA
jgi:predicted Rossmann fold flavoprotein